MSPAAFSAPEGRITDLLGKVESGDRACLAELVPLVFAELRRLAALYLSGQPAHTWQPTDLVNQMWVRLLARERLSFDNRGHFFGSAARLMRSLIVDHARALQADKRRIRDAESTLAASPDDVLAIDAALQRLADVSRRQVQVVEMRYFAGLTVEETAEALGVSPKTVKREWALARVFLREQLDPR